MDNMIGGTGTKKIEIGGGAANEGENGVLRSRGVVIRG